LARVVDVVLVDDVLVVEELLVVEVWAPAVAVAPQRRAAMSTPAVRLAIVRLLARCRAG
jgi:hypothetical protein